MRDQDRKSSTLKGTRQLSANEIEQILASPEPLFPLKYEQAKRSYQEHVEIYQIDQKIAKFLSNYTSQEKT